MKKLLTVLLAALMVFALVGCGSKEEEKPAAGGWNKVEDGTITDELKEVFDAAVDGLLGATYEPIELLETQVVSGINYKFLAKGTKTTNPITEGTYNITIYKDLEGNVELTSIDVIEETQAK